MKAPKKRPQMNETTPWEIAGRRKCGTAWTLTGGAEELSTSCTVRCGNVEN